MYNILCPNCNHSQQISLKQLKKKRNNVTCSACKLQFNARTILNSQASQSQKQEALVSEVQIPEISTLIKARSQAIEEPEAIDDPVIETYSWQQKKPAYHSQRWLAGVILGLFLLAFQVYYFKGYSLSQNPQIRPWINIFSTKLNYPLPVYRNLAEFSTIGSKLKLVSPGNYQVQISFINHADFAQRLPDILVSLHNLHGGLFARRIFTPEEYLSNENTPEIIESSANANIDFFITVPDQEIGGYSIELK
ncbi:hypothetical protein AU255_13645 [Methyloprofundus sedimenti]|uniref:Zinc finger/thioredoxin putative domain-containing protein n=1 Tax=Methyloprofundus sedimenti TaxID=1420851 RepID=A0A1V8M3K9_9GAMM|nr:DUF3426 domain-containing protein [Methyloprofundus sedimenti]OQK16144.1 hypothetical protein AU255_13645 [Methyloprofundus sedimenti]